MQNVIDIFSLGIPKCNYEKLNKCGLKTNKWKYDRHKLRKSMAIQLSECSELIDIQFKAFSDFPTAKKRGPDQCITSRDAKLRILIWIIFCHLFIHSKEDYSSGYKFVPIDYTLSI